jgi:two-component system KDP operon response regulator KdpE
MNERVLIIDDDPGLLTLMRLGLERDGYEVITAQSGKEGLRKAYEYRPDLIVLDILMPEMDGWEVCQRLRYVCDTPILILTAVDERDGVIRGLSIGADDYVLKPCTFEELKARIRALLRRSAGASGNARRTVYDDGNLRIDFSEGTVMKRGEPVSLTPTESRLLLYLASQQGKVVSHQELLTQVWGPAYNDAVGYLSVYIRYLRQKIEDDPANPRYIRTRWRVGYYFAANGTAGEGEENG